MTLKPLLRSVLIALLAIYLSFAFFLATFKFIDAVYGASYYTSVSKPELLIDQKGVVRTLGNAGKNESIELSNGDLYIGGKKLTKYQDGRVIAYKPENRSFLGALSTQIISFVLALSIFGILLHKRSFFEPFLDKVNLLIRANLLHLAIIGGFLLFAYVKRGIIDMIPFGQIIEGLQFGINYYAHGIITGQQGQLGTFPYNPLSLFFMQLISVVQADLNAIGLKAHSYSLVSVVLLLFYVWLCIELTNFLHRFFADKSKKQVFYFIFLNPLGLYYTLFLGQIDIISVALITAGVVRVFLSSSFGVGTVLIFLGIVLGKPQHLLLLPALAVALISIKEKSDIRKYLSMIVVLCVGAAIAYFIYSKIPAFSESLSLNPQAARISWSTWWSLLSDAILINRPIGMLFATFAALVFIMPTELNKHVAGVATLLAIGVLVAFFQTSFAHTFGMTIFLFPAIIILCVSVDHPVKRYFFYFASLSLLIAWGTGLEGDVSQSFGVNYLQRTKLIGKHVAGISYGSLLNTLEYVAHAIFGFVFLLVLYRLNSTRVTRPLDKNAIQS